MFSSVTFTVTDFIEGQLDCEVTEAEIDNYSAEYDNGATTSTTSCAYTDLGSGANSCLITNTPGPGSK